jgi:galactan 5-O-arabinofuranosyltransferase
VVAFFVAAAFVASSVFIHVNPLNRLGQIAGLAGLAFRFVLAAIVLVVVLVIAARRRGGAGFPLASRLVCAAVAGLATGMIGGGILVALRGTPWGINGQGGDVGYIAGWAAALHRGYDVRPAVYPPLPIHILHLYSDLVGLQPGMALKHLEIAGVAASGPIVYLAWRLLLRPVWAVGIGVVASLPLIEPYKPYPTLVLAVFVPIAIVFLQALRDSAAWPVQRVARASVVYGLAFGLLCLMYSGWFQWSVPGLAVAALLVFPWQSRRNGVYLLVFTAAIFLLITRQYALGVLADPVGIKDNYVYFDVKTEPMYIAMWRSDTPGTVGVWPPIGELGGVGLFTITLAVGLGAAIAMGRRQTVVIALTMVMLGAWLLRFQYARKLWETKLVQLYPRTTPLILYSLLILTGYTVYWLVERRRSSAPADRARSSSGLIGAVCGLLLFFASSGSAIVDRYMPDRRDPPSAGWLTFIAHETKRGYEPKKYRARPLRWSRRTDAPASDPPGPSH